MKPLAPQGGIEPLLTVANVAEVLRLSVRSVRRLMAENKLRVIRIGRAVRMRPDDLKAFLDASGRERSRDAETGKVEIE